MNPIALADHFTQRLKETCGERLVSVILFGSAARGTNQEHSDIDLCIILEQAPTSRVRRTQELLALQKQVPQGEKINGIVLTRTEALENRHLFLDMIYDGKILIDKGGFFASRLGALKKRLKELGSRRVLCPDGSWYWDLKPDLKFGESFEL